MATAIADAAAARRDYLDETGGRYVHLIADGDVQTSGDIAKALGLRGGRGDARRAAVAVGRGPRRRLVLGSAPSRTRSCPVLAAPLPRRSTRRGGRQPPALEVLLGPTADAAGR